MFSSEFFAKIPPLYSGENESDPIVVAKLFHPYSSWTWYVLEGSEVDSEGIVIEPKSDSKPDDYMFYGLVVGLERELGYFSFNELQSLKKVTGIPIERDLYWKPVRLSEVRR